MRSLICGACLTVALFGAAGSERSYLFPCELTELAPSGDGKWIWAACRAPSRLYALETATGAITELRRDIGSVHLIPSPARNSLVVDFPDLHGPPALFREAAEIAALPAVTDPLTWSPDGKWLYFNAGSTLQADAWNILGAIRVDTMEVKQTTLAVPTEDVAVCPATGHLLAGIVPFDRNGTPQPFPAAEYDAGLRFLGRNPNTPPGHFSAKCTWVASPGSFPHGPVPWRVLNVATGKSLLSVNFDGNGHEFKSWNPRRDNLLLRVAWPSSGPEELQVFDIASKIVLLRVPGVSEGVWSGDGRALIFSRGQTLVIREILLPRK